MRGRYGTSILIALALLLASFAPQASAERPDNEPEKGSFPAAAPVLPPSSASQDTAYDPVPVDVDVLYIGLSYDRGAVYEASLTNADGLGFELGSFDEDRVFHSFAELADPILTVRSEQNWYLLLDEKFASGEEARPTAERYAGTLVTLDDAFRVLIGPFKNVEEVDYTIKWYALKGTAWHEKCLAVYGASDELRYLHVSDRDLALRALSSAKARTAYGDETYFGSFIFKRGEDDRMTVVNAVELEDYVKGVIPYEMSPSWPVEALKAQAVCARSYAAYNVGVGAYEEKFGFDLTDDTESQVYRGINGADEVTDYAAETTAGKFVRYRGELCEVYYFASSGGATEDGARVFGSDRPYLAGKTDPFEQARAEAVIRWERKRSGEEIGRRLRAYEHEIGDVVKIEAAYSELGNVIAMTYYDKDGVCLSLETRDSYKPLALDNCRFTVTQDGSDFVFRGLGWGHSCGMSQWGANAMAAEYGCTAEEIIEFYFTGAYIG